MALLLFVIVVSGVVGGLASYLVRDQAGSASTTADPAAVFFGALLAGVVASFCVPLFLLLTQSKLLGALLDDALMTDAKGNFQYNLDLLYIAGFCLIAAYSSRAFLQSISTRVLHEVQEARQESHAAKAQSQAAEDQSAQAKQMVTETSSKVATAEQSILRVADVAEASARGARTAAEQARQIAARADALTEVVENSLHAAPFAEVEEEAHITEEMVTIPPEGATALTGPEEMVLRTLDNPEFRFRTPGRISAESGVPPDDLPRVLQSLVNRGLVRTTTGRTGAELHTLTPLGRQTLDAHHDAA